ncbi:MAG: ABC transporter ATP-binding protein [Geobacter sp.]|nr:MAG: ABC transporter ATP-binding protein [Geobacter sp.]
MIELMQVTKCFNAGKSNEFTAVDSVSLTIGQGLVTVLKGPSGSGKTTLLTLIGCMARPSSGRIRLNDINASFFPETSRKGGFDISSLPERFLTEIRRDTFGFIFQQFNLIKGITVLENIMLPAYPTGRGHALFRKRALELLEMFNISRHETSRVEWLSGGELQRVAIARALINDPAVIVADEPTAHLDSKLSCEFMEIIGNLKAEGKTILIASHDPIVYDSRLADQVIEMRDGRITGSGLVS